MIFSRTDYEILSVFAFNKDYPGFRPHVTELPNGDGKQDVGKKYSHIAMKYLTRDTKEDLILKGFLAAAHFEACRVAEALQVPAEYYPRVADGTLRILEYPAGVGSEEHTDFDLFTILCYRETHTDLQLTLRDWAPKKGPDTIEAARMIDPHMHIGELGELVGLGPATPHRVVARPYVQRSIVYFAMSDHNAELAKGPWFPGQPDKGYVHEINAQGGHYNTRPKTVGEWLKERMTRSRKYI
jgi:hypothetical protein